MFLYKKKTYKSILNLRRIILVKKNFFKNNIGIVFHLVNLTNKLFNVIKYLLVKSNLNLSFYYLNNKKFLLQFKSFSNIHDFFNICYRFKLIPFLFFPLQIFYNNEKTSIFNIYRILTISFWKKLIYHYILKLICHYLIYNLLKLNLVLVKKNAYFKSTNE